MMISSDDKPFVHTHTPKDMSTEERITALNLRVERIANRDSLADEKHLIGMLLEAVDIINLITNEAARRGMHRKHRRIKMSTHTVIRKVWDGFGISIDDDASLFCCAVMESYVIDGECDLSDGKHRLVIRTETEEEVDVKWCPDCGEKVHITDSVSAGETKIVLGADVGIREGEPIIEGYKMIRFCCAALKGEYSKIIFLHSKGEFCEELKDGGCSHCGSKDVKIV